MRMSRSTPAGRRQASRAAHVATIPRNTVAPAITGTAQAGQTLTTTNGTWAGNSATYARQWKRGATNVGAGGLTYVVQAGDVGSTITCVVTATNSTGSTSATSNATGTVIAAGPTLGNELVANGAFASSAGWSFSLNGGGTLGISGGTLNWTSADSGALASATPAEPLTAGTYRTVFTITSRDGGNVRAIIGGTPGTVRSAPGTYTEDIVTSATLQLIEFTSGPTEATLSVDNFSVKRLS